MIQNNSGVTKAKGFSASGIAAGIKKKGGLDLALIVSDSLCVSAGVFTQNVVKGHALQLSMEHIKNPTTKGLIINSGNANACNGERGIKDAFLMAQYTANSLGCKVEEILLGSTGVIGMPIDMDKIKRGIDIAVNSLEIGGGLNAAKAIMTTDTYPKEFSVEFELNGQIVTIGGMAKGSGMIHPNMATMISVLTTDIAIEKEALDIALKIAANKSFNRISIDGDTSVCDKLVILANGEAGNQILTTDSKEFDIFTEKLTNVCIALSKMLVADGEGATKLIEINIINALTKEDAFMAANSIVKSPLVKTAFFGEDANWGRLITALGYSGANFNPEKVDMSIGNMFFCKNGGSIGFNEDDAKKILMEKEIVVTIDLQEGKYNDRMWTCDMSYDYIKINGSYRS